jgi:hypothetical protein
MIWKIWKKSRLNSEKILKVRKKSKLNSEMILKTRKKSKLNRKLNADGRHPQQNLAVE